MPDAITSQPVSPYRTLPQYVASNPVIGSFCGHPVRLASYTAGTVAAIAGTAAGCGMFGAAIAHNSVALLASSVVCVSTSPVTCAALVYCAGEKLYYESQIRNEVAPASEVGAVQQIELTKQGE